MVAPRRVIALPTDAGQRQRLLEISRSRTEPTSRVERARIGLLRVGEDHVEAAIPNPRDRGVNLADVKIIQDRLDIEGFTVGCVHDRT